MISALISLATAVSAANVEGDWVTADRSAVVRISHCGASLCGTINRVLLRDPKVPKLDVNNPQPMLRSRPLVGLQVLSGFSPQGSKWTGGSAYDPKTGNTYRAKLAPSGGTLILTGCVLFICESQMWHRP